MAAGERRWVVLSHGWGEAPGPQPEPTVLDQALRETIHAWRAWSGRATLPGPRPDLVERSAITLALLTFRPTGAMVAAPTTSLPEHPGGVRNWDYRYTWLRDAGLVLDALQHIGYHAEAMAFWRWLETLCIRCGCPISSFYRLDGSLPPGERVLDHLEGWRGSRPVRLGNGAAEQLQLDVYGYILDAAWLCMTLMGEPHPALLPVLAHVADRAAARWREPDEGIWEVRSPRRHFAYSKMMCWVALDRAVRLAERGWLPGPVARWRRERDAVRRAVLEQGWNPRIRAFSRAFDGYDLDAAVLRMPVVGLLPATDVRVQATVDRVLERLLCRGFVGRYDGEDGLPGGEGAFLPCTLWAADALALGGQVKDALALFERVASCANDVGLLSEEVDPRTGALLGNHPQALSHLALVHTSVVLGRSVR